MEKRKYKWLWGLVLALLPVGFILASLSIGAYEIGPGEVGAILWGGIAGREAADAMAASLIWQVRLPRILGAALVGAGLSVSGAVFQGLFKNPLADPYTLGVSNGAGFGAGAAIILSLSTGAIQGCAIAMGLLAAGLTFLLAMRGRRSPATLILAGMLVSSLFSSLVSLLKFVADPFEKLPEIVFWIMGSLSGVTYEKLARILPAYLAALAVLMALRWRLNVLSMGDEEARSFGLNVRWERGLAIVACSVLTALAVSISGIIGWVGIVIPHFARMMAGPDFRRLLPMSASLGVCYLLLIDDLCRTLTASEIPIGVVTGIVGVPLFVYFIYKRRVSW